MVSNQVFTSNSFYSILYQIIFDTFDISDNSKALGLHVNICSWISEKTIKLYFSCHVQIMELYQFIHM